jgi:hypothetical protein
VVVNVCNPSIWKAEAEGSSVQGQPRLHHDLVSKRKRKRKKGGKEWKRREEFSEWSTWLLIGQASQKHSNFKKKQEIQAMKTDIQL